MNLNVVVAFSVTASDVSVEARKEGFPRKFPHKLASFRPELVDSFLL
jgi:hypothetical protein